MDFGAELNELNQQMQDVVDNPDDDIPDFIKDRKNEAVCIRDHDNDRAAIALAGSCFYVPDAERLALAPSLPPPPPPSFEGLRKWKMKPRLPLDISRNRYRDEHPSINVLRPTFVPEEKDILSLEETMKTMSFYASCDKSFSRIAQNLGTRMLDTQTSELKRMDETFGNMVSSECRHSTAWKTYLQRQRAQELIAHRLKMAQGDPEGQKARRGPNLASSALGSTLTKLESTQGLSRSKSTASFVAEH